MWFLVILNALAKNIILLIRQKSFLEENKEREWARDVTNSGKVRGGIPPSIHSTTRAIFILLEVLLKPGSPYCSVSLLYPVTLSRAYKWN